MNKTWDDSWNGQSELWDENMENCIAESPVRFNTAIIFKTNEISWHGVPKKIKMSRRCMSSINCILLCK